MYVQGTHLSTPKCTLVANALGTRGTVNGQLFMMMLTPATTHTHTGNYTHYI